MTKKKILIHNVSTGEVIEREMNVEELAQHEIDLAKEKEHSTIQATKAAEKAALLEKLGITAEEAALLLS
jgi:hypothetical protein